jgi:hypothetical protein
LWRTAEAVTLKEAPALAEAGLDTDTLFTFTSELALMFVLELLEPLLLPGVGSETWSWSIVAAAFTEKLCADAVVQLTDQLAGDPGTVVEGADTASDVFCTTTGFVPVIVQSPGAVSVSEVSTLVGP